jgi:hypothetical protein
METKDKNNTPVPLMDLTIDNLFGLTDEDFESILTKLNTSLSKIDYKSQDTIKSILNTFTEVESELDNYLGSLTHLAKQIKLIEFLKAELLAQRFMSEENTLNERIIKYVENTYEANIDSIITVDMYEHYFLDLKGINDEEAVLQKVHEIFREIFDISWVIFISKLADLLGCSNIPKFLYKKLRKRMKYRIKITFAPVLKELYHNFLESRVEVKVLKDYFRKYTKNEITIFDRNLIDNELLYNFQNIFILSNVEYLKTDDLAKETFMNGLIKYVKMLRFKDSLYDIEKRVELYLLTPSDDIKIYLSGHVEMAKNALANKTELYFYIILSFSFMLNNLIKLENNDIVFNDNLRCNSRERQFLYNILKVLSLYIDIGYDAFTINSYVQSIIVSKVLKTFSNNLYDDDLKFKKEIYCKDVIKHIETEGNKEIVDALNLLKPSFTDGAGFLNKMSQYLSIITGRFVTSNVDVSKIRIQPYENLLLSTNACLCISGFTSEDCNHNRDWENLTLVLNKFIDFYFFSWPAETVTTFLRDIGLIIGRSIFNLYTSNYFDLVADIKNYTHSDNIFLKAKTVAKLCGKILALIIASRTIYNFQTITLSGFSLGTHVIKHCIKQLYLLSENDPSIRDVIQNVVLVAGATSFKNRSKWRDIFNTMVAGRVINCYGYSDSILKYLYRFVTLKNPVGLEKLMFENCYKFENSDVSDLKIGHRQYRKMLDVILKRIKLYN